MLGDRPSFAALIPTCDRPHIVDDAIKSVLNQTRPADEVIIVDNGKEPVTNQINDMGVTVCRIDSNAGVSRARNFGVASSSADYLAFLDDDDTWAPDYLEVMEEAIRANPGVDLLLGRLDKVVRGERVVHKCVRNARGLYSKLLYMNPGVGGTNLVVRREMFAEIDGFDENLRNANDRGLVLDLLEAGSVVVTVPGAAAIMGETEVSRIRSRKNQSKTRRYFLKKYRDKMCRGMVLRNLGLIHRHMGGEALQGWRRIWFGMLGRVESWLGRLLTDCVRNGD